MPPNHEALIGRQAITDDMVAMFEGMGAELTISSEEVEVAGDWAFDRGHLYNDADAEGGR